MTSGDIRYGLGSLDKAPAIAVLIGEFIARWSLAEATLILPLLVAMNSRGQEVAAAILASTNSTEGKIKLVRTAVENMQRHHEKRDPIRSSLKTLMSLCEHRNSLCHHTWAFDFVNNHFVTIDYRKEQDPGRNTERSEADLRDLCNRTMVAAKAISAAAGSSWVTDEIVELRRL